MKSKKKEREFYFCFDTLTLAGTVALAVNNFFCSYMFIKENIGYNTIEFNYISRIESSPSN